MVVLALSPHPRTRTHTGGLVDRRLQVPRHEVGRLGAVDSTERRSHAVVIHQRLRAPRVDPEPFEHNRLAVVRALSQLATTSATGRPISRTGVFPTLRT